ncbi:DUF2513 domain-containing protein [Halalkalibacter krulwichiae]|uniref:DUF2513 domain-containing protein n=1 Tax=Halalkalibacter krulwichiae TaxID=199441 RepID=A0A1Y9THT1_9BACI|nr:DUF2513 domain-containing protein [Halalkalibacter krulwichiae]ARK28745.1 hypothetical protein BkAM31D_02160 [Halalkalibacter krulwichiae]
MKLNHDCVRHALLELEEKMEFLQNLTLTDIKEFESFHKYGEEDFIYSLLKLKDAGYIVAEYDEYYDQSYDMEIKAITWDGHSFLDNIRDPIIWKKVKGVSGKLASVSIPFLSKLAWHAVTNYFSLSD